MPPMYLRSRCRYHLGYFSDEWQLEASRSSTAGMPAKLNLSQLCRHVGGKDWDDQCCRHFCPHMGTVSQAVPAVMSQVHWRHMRTRLYLCKKLFVLMILIDKGYQKSQTL